MGARKFVTLRVWHPGCWMLEACEHHHDLTIETRGVSTVAGIVHAGAVVTSQSQSSLRAALAEPLPRDVHREVLHTGQGFAETYSRYPVARSMVDATVSTGFVLVSPVVHHDGYERWEVLADTSTLSAGIEKLRETAEVRVERVSDTRSGTTPRPRADLPAALRDELSDRQYEILRRAVDAGYYDWPRGKNVKLLAEELGISGPTCLEHIRRAESRIVPRLLSEMDRQNPRARSLRPRE